jgi:hypothetical protein
MRRRFSLSTECRDNSKSDEPPGLAVTGTSHKIKKFVSSQA